MTDPRIEKLEQALTAMLRGDEVVAPTADRDVASLVGVAADLRRLPGDSFRAKLRYELVRRAEMTNQDVPVPDKEVKFREGFGTVTPYLAARRAAELIDFVKKAFGGEELMRAPGSGGGFHAEVRIEDSIVMIGGGEAFQGPAKRASLHFYVPDADAAYRRAIESGAESLYPPTDMDYGDREAGVRDLCGNQWFIATHQATGHAPQGLHSITPGLRASGASGLLDFLKRAFATEEFEVHKAPDGSIIHAKVRVGTSLVEVGEAHGQWQPLSSMFFLYVEDVDAWYRRAVSAGAESIQEPADQPYGDRVGAVRDPFGHTWYLGTPIGTL